MFKTAAQSCELLTIALVSGKGGVGKTVLAVACAQFLSKSNRTLVIDLDFFNRALTGLLSQGDVVHNIDAPDFLPTKDTVDDAWQILRVTDNLFHIRYPDLREDQIRIFETLHVERLRRSLERFIRRACLFV
jgi:cellulose biosynthesis protein BcsQ